MTMIRNKIRKRRQELNMSRVQLAEAVQVTPSAIANYENGISYPKPDIFVALMITLEVDANYFYEEYVRNREIAIACKRAITQDEIYALEKYRQLTSSGKKLVRMVIEEEYSRMQQEEWISFPCMKDMGGGIDAICKKRAEYLDTLVKSRFIEMFGDPDTNEKGWKINTFGEICSVRQGLQIPISKRLTEYEDDCYEYITVQYLHGGKEREYIKNPKSTVICTKDDILMTRTGNTGMVVTGVDGVFHNNFFLIDFDRNKYDKDFLIQYLKLDIIQADILRRAGTSTIPDLNHGEFYKIKVFEPPIELQDRFKDFLIQTDKSKLAVQKSLDELETLKKSLMQEYFG